MVVCVCDILFKIQERFTVIGGLSIIINSIRNIIRHFKYALHINEGSNGNILLDHE